MKTLHINDSLNTKDYTFTALSIVAEELQKKA